jgi:putative flippase GtrA
MFTNANLYRKVRLNFQSTLPAVYDFCSRHKSVVKFTIAGGLASVVDLILLYFFHDPLGLDIVVAATLAFILSFLISFSLQKFWTFRDYGRGRTAGQFLLYFVNAVIGLNLNGFLMHLLVNRYGVWYLLAQVIVIGAIGLGNFLVYKFIIFKKKYHEAVGR